MEVNETFTNNGSEINDTKDTKDTEDNIKNAKNQLVVLSNNLNSSLNNSKINGDIEQDSKKNALNKFIDKTPEYGRIYNKKIGLGIYKDNDVDSVESNISESEINHNYHNKYGIVQKVDDGRISDSIKSLKYDKIRRDSTKLINEHLSEIQIRISCHKLSARIYNKRERIITFPITILATFIASSIMVDLTGTGTNFQLYMKYTGLVISFLLGLLNELRKYFDFAKLYKDHDLSSKLYTTLSRSIEIRLIQYKLVRNEKYDIFKDIVNQMSIIEQYEPDISKHIERKIRDKIE